VTWFEWDTRKARDNQRKHRVSFEAARHVFDDPAALFDQDRTQDGELRWQTLGLAEGTLLLLVAHTVEEHGANEVVRIISARRANRREKERYERNRQENYG
jgi:uncharacterized DUF497 family protein